MSRIDVNLDTVDWDDDGRLLHEGIPFTGEALEILDDRLTHQEFYENGVPHGAVRAWWPDGTPKSEGQVRHGLPYGTFRGGTKTADWQRRRISVTADSYCRQTNGTNMAQQPSEKVPTDHNRKTGQGFSRAVATHLPRR